MQALINAGGKGSRMGECGIEKPMQIIGGKPAVVRVVDALMASKYIDKVLVSVSDHTIETERCLMEYGVETIRTSGESFMDDLHESFKKMEGEYVLVCPSDLPLISTNEVNIFIDSFDPNNMESLIALVKCSTVKSLGITPSYTVDRYGHQWVVSGISIMSRNRTLNGEYLQESYYHTECPEFAVNVNTQKELKLAKDMFV